MKRLTKNILYGGLLPLLLAVLFASCNDEMVDAGGNASSGKMGSVTFRLGGISGSVSTRSNDGDPVSIDLNSYAVKAFVFRHNPESDALEYYKEQEVTQSLVTIDGITKDVNHAYVFVAVPKWAEQHLVLKCYPKESPTKMEINGDGVVTQSGTTWNRCYLPVFEEPGVDEKNNLKGDYTFKVITDPETGEDFKIYAWGNETPVGHGNDTYTPDLVVFAPQFGKVRFKANDGQTITSCNIYSNVYRFYMSQVIGKDPTVENGLTIENSVVGEVYSDFLVNYENGNLACITKDFSGESSYEVCMPCTTLGTDVPSDDKKNEFANTFGTGTAWEGSEEGEGDEGWPNPTSATVNGVKIETKTAFPIFRKRTTVLGIKDDKTMTVKFEDDNKKPGIGLDDDEWNGLTNN